MNPFRSRKKSFAEADNGKSRPSLENAPPLPASNTSSRGMTFRRKKEKPEPKPELNLQDALPKTDDFRTSLLMPNLSARFSMLREQDDPNSMLGKANDDSVLFPRRHSKLNLFSPDGLSDIAEVSSLAGSIRPPFAREGRTNSYASADGGYGTDDDHSINGSMMSRAKPGQGNKFFGGRQKVYKISDGASSRGDLNGAKDDGPKPMGKAMYNDDISMSAFQKLREERKQRGSLDDDDEQRNSNENNRSGSPPLAGYNRNRETSSSTNSGPGEGRTSTAATSIASQPGTTWLASSNGHFSAKGSPVTTPGERPPNKGKRMYGQGLDQHMMEQQSSALNRLNSIQRSGFNGMGNGMGLSRSTSNLHERFQKGPFSPANNARSGSPSPVTTGGLGGFDFGTNGASKLASDHRDKDGIMRDTPPMSPVADPTLTAALNANDLGKATASGAFNKPKTQYNEQQFAQRQLQLQEGRETPPPRAFSRQGSNGDFTGRLRNGSMASMQSAHSAKNQYRNGSNSRAPSNASNSQVNLHGQTQQAINGTYLADLSGSERESGPSSPEPPLKTLTTLKPTTYNSADPTPRSTVYEHDDQHPAFRNQPDRLYIEPSDDEEELSRSSSEKQKPTNEEYKGHNALSLVDSPTLGATNDEHLGGGLSEMVKGHLRNQSNTSSVYPDSPEFDQENTDDGPWKPTPTSNPGNAVSAPGMPPHSALGNRARQVLEQASQLANANNKAHDVLGGLGADKVQQVLGGEAPRRSNESARYAWQDQLKGHTRGASTETQKEREDFANELADRRKQVQEKLKNFTDDGPKAYPNQSTDNSPAKSGPFGLLKKSSRGSLVQNNEPSKAAKMLGITSPPHSTGPSPTLPSDGFRRPTVSEANGKSGPGDGLSFRDRSIGAERREKFFRKTNATNATIERFNAPEATPPPPPAPFGFSRSRTDPANQPNSYHPAGRARKYSPPRPTTVTPTMEVPTEPTSRSNSAMGHRNGPAKSPAGSYFPPQLVISPNGNGSSVPNLPPTMGNPRPSPVAPAYSAHNTPPLEMPPHVQQPQAPVMMSQNSSFQPTRGAPRKRSINKHDISEPKFLSGTSSVITVDLPAGASLTNGMDELPGTPPVPPINPRRRRAQPTQNLFTAFGNKSPNMATHSQPNSAYPGTPESPHEEVSTFSGDEDSKPSRPRTRLRKTSSEGGNLAAKARHHALMKEASQMPHSPMGARY